MTTPAPAGDDGQTAVRDARGAPPPSRGEHDVPGWAAVVGEGLTGGDAFASRADEHRALRSVASRDLGLGRVLDGHRNALERIQRHRPEDVAEDDRAVAEAGLVPHGVWGADPHDDEGVPAAIDRGGATVSGTKVFCSGAGLVDRALVLVGSEDRLAGTVCALVDVSDPERALVDRRWFRGEALRSSASHRVVLDRAPVLAVLASEPDGRSALLAEPWFSGDALRTAVTWAGALDRIVDGTTTALQHREPTDSEAAILARAHAARASVDLWLDHATRVRENDPGTARRVVLLARLEITERCREALRACAELTGSRPIAVGDDVARARADLDLLLLQHRLSPAAVRLGRELLDVPR